MFLYESHTDGIYTSSYELDYEDTYCETCGDSDSWLGEFETKKELIELMKSEGYGKKYISEVVGDCFK